MDTRHTNIQSRLVLAASRPRYLATNISRKNGGQGVNGLASLALRAHFVRLSALRASDEHPTRGFSVNRFHNPPKPKVTQ